MDGIVALLLSKKFTKDTVIGMGAIKGAACQVQSINKVGKTTTVTLKWEDNDGGVHTQAFDLEDGLDGVSVSNATIKPNGHLELTLSNGTTIDCGKVLPQYDTMPTPSSSNEGQILQYIGTTTSNYTNGYFYQCVESPVGSGTYVWVQKNVQPNNGGGGGDGVVDGYYNSADQLFYEDSAFLNPITGEDNTIYIDLNTNGLYRYDGTIFIKVSSIQVTTLPTADVTQLDKIYQYVGTTDANYTKGYFYRCVLDGAVYKWVNIATQDSYTKAEIGNITDLPDDEKNVIENIVDLDDNKENLFRYMRNVDIPVASIDNAGKIIQYIGNTTPNYISGFFYQSQFDSETSTYKWVNIEVQPTSGTSAVESVNNKTGVVILDAKDIGLQVITMPNADIDHLGNIVQYVGTTDVNYTNGRFYKCVYDGVSTYSWVVAEDYISKSGTVGLVKNDGSIDQNQYAKEVDLAQEFSTATNYVIGDYVTYLGNFYKFTSNHNAGAWDSNDVITVDVVTLLGNKTDRVSSATNGNFAGLDASGNLTDSGKKASDFILATEKGANEGVAELDTHGKVPSSQLPSYVDDVIDGYYYDNTHFYEEAGMSGYYNIADNQFYKDSEFTELITPVLDNYYLDISTGNTYQWDGSAYVSGTPTRIVGESGVIYISVDTDIQYRWTGTAFSALGGALQLGETSSTAYRGDRGKIAYDHSQITDGSNPHNTTANNVNLATSISVDGDVKSQVEEALDAINTLAGNNKTSLSTKADLADLASAFDDTASYAIGDYVAYEGNVYRFITNHTGAWESGDVINVTISDDLIPTFTGTQAQWDALSLADKKKYKICNITDDGSTGNVYTVSEVDALLNEKLNYAMYEEEIHGVNLLENKCTSQTVNGLTITVNTDKSVKITGTASTATNVIIQQVIAATENILDNLEIGQSYIFSGCPAGGATNTYAMVMNQRTVSGGTVSYKYDTGNGYEFTYDGTFTSYQMMMQIWPAAGNVNLTFKPMLRKADIEDSTYRPYNNQAIQNQLNAQGVLGAKNLLPNIVTTQTKNGITWTKNSDGTLIVNGTATAASEVAIISPSSYNTAGLFQSGRKYIYSIGIPLNMLSTYGIEAYADFRNDTDTGWEDGIPIDTPFDGKPNKVGFYIRVKNGVTVNNLVFKPMVRLASDPDDTYQPYAMTNKELTDKTKDVAVTEVKSSLDSTYVSSCSSFRYVVKNGICFVYINNIKFTSASAGVTDCIILPNGILPKASIPATSMLWATEDAPLLVGIMRDSNDNVKISINGVTSSNVNHTWYGGNLIYPIV